LDTGGNNKKRLNRHKPSQRDEQEKTKVHEKHKILKRKNKTNGIRSELQPKKKCDNPLKERREMNGMMKWEKRGEAKGKN